MRNKLLITTALVALISANNAFAQESLPDLSVTDNQELTESTGVSYNTINVTKEGTLTLTGANIKTSTKDTPTTDITVNGTLNLKDGSVLEAGSDIDGLANNSNILLDGATVTMSNSDLEANGNITINNTKLSASTTNSGWYGVWADNDLTATDSEIELNNSYLASGGKLTIDGGTIDATNGSLVALVASEKIVLQDGAILNIAQGTTLSAGIYTHNVDSLNEVERGTLTLNDGSNTEKPIINLGGTLDANVSGNDRSQIYFQNSDAKIDGNVDGVSLIFEDSHTLSEAVTGEIDGLNIFEIQKGTLTYDKELAGGASSVWVDSGATLDIGTNALHSGGDKDYPGEGVHFKDNSTLKFTVTDKDTYGKIYANYVNISENGTTLDMNLNSAALKEGDEPLKITLFNPEDNETVDIEGKFANLTSNSRYDFADNGDGTYTVTANGTTASDVVAEAGGTASNAATAEAWDNVSAEDSSPVAAEVTKKFAELAGSTDSASQQAYVAALTAVAPEVAPMVQKTQTETANQVFSAVSTRLTGGSISTGSEGMSSGDTNPDAAVWVQGMYNHSELDDTSKAKGFDADSAGVALGIEKFINKDVKIGAGYAYTNTDIDGFMRSTDVDTHTAILYGEYKPSNWYVNGIATYGWSDYSEDKSIAGVGVKADYDVETFGLQAMTGYDMNVNGFGFTPEVGLRYVHIKQDAYTDSADQKVSGNDSDILTGVIGAKVNKTFALDNGMLIKPEARIAATYDMINDDVNSVVTLANGSAYAVEGEALDRFGMEFGAGITAEVNDNVEFSLGYEGKFREDYQDHTGLINAKYKF